MSKKAAALAAEAVDLDKESLISFPAGDTPLGMVKEFVKMANSGSLDISRNRYVSLDEWAGLDSETEGSCAFFNRINLFEKLEKPFAEAFIINGKALDLAAECKKLDAFIDRFGPLGLSVLGIGLNGHLGFNEEGVDFNLKAHVTPLSETTKFVMGKYFRQDYDLQYGITQGLKQIMEARRVILIASGSAKSDILRRALKGKVDSSVPASILQGHPNLFVVADKEAASAL